MKTEVEKVFSEYQRTKDPSAFGINYQKSQEKRERIKTYGNKAIQRLNRLSVEEWKDKKRCSSQKCRDKGNEQENEHLLKIFMHSKSKGLQENLSLKGIPENIMEEIWCG